MKERESALNRAFSLGFVFLWSVLKMYICKESGTSVYETIDELLKSEINYVTEFEGFYYFDVKSTNFYDNCIWKVNKTTGEVEYMMFTQYLCEGLKRKAKPITVEEILSERKRKCS